MAESNTDKIKRKKINSTVASCFNTLEWLIIAFILAFTFRAFVVEAFRIPTGSMAPTLRGDHFSVACEQCGHQYDYGFLPQNYRKPADVYTINPATHCPNCGLFSKTRAIKRNGDRILVFKCGYHFTEPKRWDVFVFKNPTNPLQNYIKRLIGLPGEKLEFIDGDVYIDDEIARKPEKVQNILWLPVYDNDLQPARPQFGNFNLHSWALPFKNVEGSSWILDQDNSRNFYLESAADEINTIYYDTELGNDFAAEYGYNHRLSKVRPQCSDLKVSFYAKPENDGIIGSSIIKYGRKYSGSIDISGKMIISETVDGQENILAEKTVPALKDIKPTEFSFAIVDHLLKLDFAKYSLSHDMGLAADSMGTPDSSTQPEVDIFGSGKLKLSHISIKRDMYYFSKNIYTGGTVRAGQDNPFFLGEDEFFACGDNSPESADSRLWHSEGLAVDKSYRKGIVPREYLVGKAFYVYWPSGFKATINPKWGPLSKLPFIPNISKMRLIYGGK